MMNRNHLIVLTLASGLGVAGLPLLGHAQTVLATGDAIARAEQTCLDNGLAPNSAAFNGCVEGAASAYDRGLPLIAQGEARIAADARTNCLRYGLDPYTLGYRQCVNTEMNRDVMPSRIVYSYPTTQYYVVRSY
jgi:hypothetical protein